MNVVRRNRNDAFQFARELFQVPRATRGRHRSCSFYGDSETISYSVRKHFYATLFTAGETLSLFSLVPTTLKERREIVEFGCDRVTDISSGYVKARA